MGLREEKKARTRRDLVQAALRLFDERGFESTPVRAVADACRVSPATVYVYFPAKEDLVFPDRELQVRLFADVLAVHPPQPDPRVALVLGVRALLTSPGWSIDPDDPLAAARVRIVTASPTLRARALVELAELQQQWATLLQRAYPEQLDDTTAAAHTGAVLGAIVAVAVRYLRSPTAETRHLSSLVERALDAVSPPRASTSPG